MSSSASLYGKGFFTTIAINEGVPLLWEKHWRRLSHDALRLKIDLSEHTEESSLKTLLEKLTAGGLGDGRARLTFYDNTPNAIWPDGPCGGIVLEVITGERRSVPEEFRLTVSKYAVNTRSPLVGVKSCNYLAETMALDEAKGRGFHEAVRLNERGRITGGCMSNIFWLSGEKLYTAALSTGCLAGTTREYVLENMECIEVEADASELASADAIFLTSAGLGVVRVSEFEGRKLEGGQHPIMGLWPPRDDSR